VFEDGVCGEVHIVNVQRRTTRVSGYICRESRLLLGGEGEQKRRGTSESYYCALRFQAVNRAKAAAVANVFRFLSNNSHTVDAITIAYKSFECFDLNTRPSVFLFSILARFLNPITFARVFFRFPNIATTCPNVCYKCTVVLFNCNTTKCYRTAGFLIFL